MDTVSLRQELDSVATEFQLRIRDGASAADLLPAAQAAEAAARRLDIPDFIAVALMRRAEILASLGRDEAVIAALEEARRVLGDWRQQDLGVRVLALLAETRARQADWPRVSELCREGIELTERFRYKVSSQYLQSGYLRYRIGLYTHGVRAAFELGEFNLMLQRAELSKCRSLLRPQDGPADPAAGKAFSDACAQIDSARSHGRDVAGLLMKRRTLWDLLVIERQRARFATPDPEFSLPAVQAALAADEAVLYYYWLAPESLLVVSIDASECHAVIQPVSAAQRRDLESLAGAISGFTDGSLSTFDPVAALAPVLIPAAAAGWWKAKRRLLISPHRLLHSLPLHAVRWDDAWLIERFAITHIPNLTSLLRRHAPPIPPRLGLFGIADYAVPGLARPLASLPQAETEVADVARICADAGIPCRLLVGAEAREEKIQEMQASGELARFSCLHFAMHGQNLNADTPMESHLFLRDSLLDGLEIANWKIDADLVVLSACCSGQRATGGRGLAELPGDELFGLTAAFFAAGARKILSTLWPVDSHAAVPITTGFHRHLVAGLSPEFAFQRSIRDYLAGARVLRRKIYYWAPFFLSALGRPHTPNPGRD